MAKKLMNWKTKGMNRDLSVTAFNPEFAFENRNLRLGTNEANTLMSWVCEKGTSEISLVEANWVEDDDSTKTSITSIEGEPVGTAVINHQLVLFTTDTNYGDGRDYIYILKYADEEKTQMMCKMLFGKNHVSLGFDASYPLETLVSYESEAIQKVYWTDGINQPRMINVEGDISQSNTTQFDFIPTLALSETVTVKKILGATGVFAPGVIQYAFTYYNKYGQESNIFYTTPLLYTSHKDRGGSPEDKVENAFLITVDNLDMRFDYLRIYSIMRTSLDATPAVKRIQDIDLRTLAPYESDPVMYKASFLDIGTTGENVDPTQLLYIGGEAITAETMEQKDSTLFLGNITRHRPQLSESLITDVQTAITNMVDDEIPTSLRKFQPTVVSTGSYSYANQLTSYDSNNTDKSVPCSGFKYGDQYRLGVQFQYKTGKWSDPIWVGDYVISERPSINSSTSEISVPIFEAIFDSEVMKDVLDEGYKRVRPLVVFPGVQDRNIICQGVINPTLYTSTHRNVDQDIYAQSSWFFRPLGYNSTSDISTANGAVCPTSTGSLQYTSNTTSFNPSRLRQVEIEGQYDTNNRFSIDKTLVTLHSPDIEFDEQLSLLDYLNTNARQVGNVLFTNTLADISIQTSTPTTSSSGSGFVHKSFSTDYYGIVSGLFYDDYSIDDTNSTLVETWINQRSPFKWMVYPWSKTGSLNNDFNRPSTLGTRTAVLKKKVISNLRYASTNWTDDEDINVYNKLQIFSSNEDSILKLISGGTNNIYKGNVNTMLVPDEQDGKYFSFSSTTISGKANVNTPFYSTSTTWWKTFAEVDSTSYSEYGFWLYSSSSWKRIDGDLGNKYQDIVVMKEPVRIKYKSTPHGVLSSYAFSWGDEGSHSLPIIEITQTPTLPFGGKTSDALRENIWVPCGEPVNLVEGEDATVKWEYGDTYYQRWDCLKTYPFTQEDENQIVEIGSFMLETRTNIDGRYDKNRGQMNNLNMSPVNFNLLNPVYSQTDNFFQYRIQDEDYYDNNDFTNIVSWTKAKTSGADIDLWTNIILSNNLELDGDKGEITSLQRFNNSLLCFQSHSMSQILYNENTVLTTQEGVPVEISNSGKVQGKNYVSSTVGCTNKWSIVTGALGIYFMDSNGKNIYLFNGQLNNLSTAKGFNTWCKLYIPSSDVVWNTSFPEAVGKSSFVSFYDNMNQEVLFANNTTALAYAEHYGVFTSFYDYGGIPFFNNLDDTGIWIKSNTLWKHQAGDYCSFFGANKPYSTILIGNPEPVFSKIFTNIEFRACVDEDGVEEDGVFYPYLPFDTLDAWNEYQHGIAYLKNTKSHAQFQHHILDNSASLKRKFRIWRCDIPRDNAENNDVFDETFDETFHMLSRLSKHPQDRMVNPWLYLRLRKAPADSGEVLERAEIQDVVMTYYR